MAQPGVSLTRTPFGVTLKAVGGLRKRLEDPDAVLRAVGGILLAQAHSAFDQQRLGDIRWKKRYPSQTPPVINIAGSLSDLRTTGKKPKADRFQNRPAGVDTGSLKRSLSVAIKGNTVEVGSVLPYASVIQWGGISSQPVTGEAKKALAKWMMSLRGARRRIATYDSSSKSWGPKKPGGSKAKKSKGPKKASRAKPGKKGTKAKAKKGGSAGSSKTTMSGAAGKKFKQTSTEIQRADKLGFLFSKTVLRTKVIARPYLGITSVSARKIRETVVEGFQHGGR